MSDEMLFEAPPGYSLGASGTIEMVFGEVDEVFTGPWTEVSIAASVRVSAALTLSVEIRDLAAGRSPPVRLPWRDAGAARKAVALPAGPAVALPGPAARVPWGNSRPTPGGAVRVPWGDYLPLTALTARLPWGVAVAQARQNRLPWDTAVARHTGRRLPWQTAEARHARRALPWDTAQARRTARRLPWGPPAYVREFVELPWGPGRLVRAPLDPWNPQPPATGNVWPPQERLMLFCAPSELDGMGIMLFGEDCAPRPRIPDGLRIDTRTTYMQVHSLAAFRLPDMAPLPVESFTLAADVDAIGWTVNITGRVELMTLLAPSGGLPARARLVIDGSNWDFFVQGLRRNRGELGRVTATAVGASVSALLAEPTARERSYLSAVPMTAEQIAEEALQYTGVTLDWRLTDWLVPAGAWSHRGTPMSALRRVADAAGGIVQSPRTGDAVILAPRYPILPWAWAAETPDVTLALDPIDTEGYERTDRPAFEGVYISGQAQGVLAVVKRTGTAPAADKLLPMVTDELITDYPAARQRGESLLGAGGPQARMTLRLQVLTGELEPGVIDPGKLVLVNDPAGAWRGLTRSVQVEGDLAFIRQTVVLERHL